MKLHDLGPHQVIYSLFQEAVQTGQLAQAKHFLDLGLDPNFKGVERPLLFTSVEAGQFEMTRLLVAAGADPKLRDQYGDSVLISLLANEKRTDIPLTEIEALADYFLDLGVNPHSVSTSSVTALQFAAKRGSLKLVRRLLSMGVNPYIAYRPDGYQGAAYSPLIMALEAKKTDVALFLIDQMPTLPNTMRVLHTAAENGLTEVLPLLLEKGLLIRWHDLYDSQLPIIMAAQGGHLKAVQFLWQADPYPNGLKDNPEIMTAAAQSGNLELVKWLLASGFATYDGAHSRENPQPENKHIVKHAIESNNAEVVKLLLAQAAPGEKKPDRVQEWLELALKKANIESIVLLKPYLRESMFQAQIRAALSKSMAGYTAESLPKLLALLSRPVGLSEFKSIALAAAGSDNLNVLHYLAQMYPDPFQSWARDLLRMAVRMDSADAVRYILTHTLVDPSQIPDLLPDVSNTDRGLVAYTHDELTSESGLITIAQVDRIGRLLLDFCTQNKSRCHSGLGQQNMRRLLEQMLPDTRARLSPLAQAFQAVDLERSQTLINAGARFSSEDQASNSALVYLATVLNHTVKHGGNAQRWAVILRELLSATEGAQLGETALMLAVESGNEAGVEALLKTGVAALPTENAAFDLVLTAFKSENPALLKALFKAGIDPQQKHSDPSLSLLDEAVMRTENYEIVETLLKYGVSPLSPVSNQHALDSAASIGNEEILNLLLGHVGDKWARLPGAYAVLNQSAESSSYQAFMRMLDLGVSLSADRDASTSLLAYTAQAGFLKGSHRLLAAGVSANVQDFMGRTPLMLALYKDNPETVSLLLAAGADVNLQDNEGKTAVIYLAQFMPDYQGVETLKELLQAGADVRMPDTSGQSAIDYARLKNPKGRVVQALLAEMR